MSKPNHLVSPDLDPQAKALLQSYKRGQDPSEQDASRVWDKVAGTMGWGVALPIALSSGTTQAGQVTSAKAAAAVKASGLKSVLALKATKVAALGLGVGTAGVVVSQQMPRPRPPQAAIASPPASSARPKLSRSVASADARPTPEEAKSPKPDRTPHPPRKVRPGKPKSRRTKRSGQALSPMVDSGLGTQLEQLGSSDKALRRGDLERAQHMLRSFRAKHPSSPFLPDIKALELLLACQKGQRPNSLSASTMRQRLGTSYSKYRQRIEKECK